MKYLPAAALLTALAAPALAESDAAAGEKTFGKCKSCHQIVSDSGETLAKGGRTGPNLFGIVGQTAGTAKDFRYGDDLVAAGEAGLVWDEEQFVAYLEDPRGFLKTYLDDSGAKSRMSFRLKSGGADVFAYLAQFGAPDTAASD
ncbi:c-type cytochrome [Tritonibacter horizontis]|uniref:Cytochrome c-551 n=1 Tax=Tritonibacter horizontis TaxID=1768241 RepID=A0A132C188_9RHOB|nr:cytochrome C [Tritonibacter horizontis]KUP94331.1 cytochrome c-551 precursor [Tritonibacter horizontis]